MHRAGPLLKNVLIVGTGAASGYLIRSAVYQYSKEEEEKRRNPLLKQFEALPKGVGAEESSDTWSSASSGGGSAAKMTSGWDYNWDRREPLEIALSKPGFIDADEGKQMEMIAKETPKAVRNIFLVRHGQYHTEAAEKDGRKLTPLGREQASLLGKRLAEAKDKFKFNECTFSTMVRARETGQLMLKEMPHMDEAGVECRHESMLEEGAPYPPEPPIPHWRPSSKSFHKHHARIEAAFRSLFHRASTKQKENSFELVVCHANVIRYFVCRALQFPPEGWLRISLANTSVTWLQIQPDGRVILKGLGDFGHLPPEKLSFG